jgi:hypothetical protein
MSKLWRLILTVLLPLTIGGLTYILFRAASLKMFGWFKDLGFSEIITFARQSISDIELPQWTIYNLPDALWLFAFTNLMLLLWDNKFTRHSIFWILVAPIIGLLSELGQAIHFIPGTFDFMDLTLLIFATTLPFMLNYKKLNTKIKLV